MENDIWGSEQAYREAFGDGLEQMLENPGLGVFILVAANAALDENLTERLREPLQRRFADSLAAYRDALTEGRALGDTDDDVLVFLKMATVGLHNLRPPAFRRVGAWEFQFNHLRAFRPPRNAHQSFETNRIPFDSQAFNFNRPFLRKETLWRGELGGRSVDLLYNKFPFIDYHALLVPERVANRQQWLTEDDHHYLWRLCEQHALTLPGIALAYNSIGAFASVNHLHFHLFLRQAPLPVERSEWRHNGGAEVYPSVCVAFDSAKEAWQVIEQLNNNGQSYNLLYRPGRLWCLPRRKQGSYAHSEWTAGFAWYEMAGGVVCYNRSDFETLRENDVTDEFRRLACEP